MPTYDRLRCALRARQEHLEQFRSWLGNVLQGDFGTSISTRQPVLGLVLDRLPATLELSLLALLIAVLLGGALAILGIAAARAPDDGRHRHRTTGVGLSVPDSCGASC
jgi:peptide/nickel transport system permease protein